MKSTISSLHKNLETHQENSSTLRMNKEEKKEYLEYSRGLLHYFSYCPFSHLYAWPLNDKMSVIVLYLPFTTVAS